MEWVVLQGKYAFDIHNALFIYFDRHIKLAGAVTGAFLVIGTHFFGRSIFAGCIWRCSRLMEIGAKYATLDLI